MNKFTLTWRQMRELAGYTRDELLAEDCGVAATSLYFWRKGQSQPRADKLRAIVNKLRAAGIDVTMESLLDLWEKERGTDARTAANE